VRARLSATPTGDRKPHKVKPFKSELDVISDIRPQSSCLYHHPCMNALELTETQCSRLLGGMLYNGCRPLRDPLLSTGLSLRTCVVET